MTHRCNILLDTPPDPGLPEKAGLIPSSKAHKGAVDHCRECGQWYRGIGGFWKPCSERLGYRIVRALVRAEMEDIATGLGVPLHALGSWHQATPHPNPVYVAGTPAPPDDYAHTG